MDGSFLYGRQGDFDAVTTTRPGFLLVVGDSGIGKSSFLSSLNTWPRDALISKPIVLKSVQGSLQTALADAISDCMSQYLESAQDPQTAWSVVKSIGERVTSVSGREILNAVLAGTLTYAESKLGKETVEIGKRVLGDITKGGLLGFDDQLAKIRVPDRGTELCAIAAALSEIAGRPIVLRLDNAERLSSEDQGLMAELTDAVSGSVWIIACVTKNDDRGDELIQQVSLRGTLPHELPALTTPAIEQWLAAAEVTAARWEAITRISTGYPLFIEDAIRLSGAEGSLDSIPTRNGFQALMKASWKRLPETIRTMVARLAPFADPPPADFLTGYLRLTDVELGVLIDKLIESGIFVRRSDGDAWFHDRRRAFIWEIVLVEKLRSRIATEALEAVGVWIEARKGIETWVLPAAALLTRAAGDSSTTGPSVFFHTLSDAAIALLWGLIEVFEPSSAWAPGAVIGEVVRHAEARSGLTLDALPLIRELEKLMLVETLELQGVGIMRSMIEGNTDAAALLGEIQFRFHTTPRPRFATVTFGAFVRPVLGPFEDAILNLGRSTLADHKQQSSQLLRSAQILGGSRQPLVLGGTVTIDDQAISFTARFSTAEARSEAERTIQSISELTHRVQLVRSVPMPQPRLRYARYRVGSEMLRVRLEPIRNPTDEEILRYFDQRAQYVNALGAVSSSDEIEALDLARRRYLLALYESSGGWKRSFTGFAVRTSDAGATQLVSEGVTTPHDPLSELQLRAAGHLSGGERILGTLFRGAIELQIPHPLLAVLDDLERLGKEYNAGSRSLLFPPDASMLEREIRAERQRVFEVRDALVAAGAPDAADPRPSTLVAFWEDTESGWGSDFGDWQACAFTVDDGRGAVMVRRVAESPMRKEDWPNLPIPEVFEDYVGAAVSSVDEGDASAIIARLLGYGDHDARIMDLDTDLGRAVRHSGTYMIIGECDDQRSAIEIEPGVESPPAV